MLFNTIWERLLGELILLKVGIAVLFLFFMIATLLSVIVLRRKGRCARPGSHSSFKENVLLVFALTLLSTSVIIGFAGPVVAEGTIYTYNAELLGSATSASVFYVAPDGDDADPGTVDQPWRTIQHAAETLVAGDTVFIRGGVYKEQAITVHDGNSVNGYIVFSAYPGETPILDGTDVTKIRDACFIVSHSYIKLVGLEICNWDTGIWMENCGHIEISDCEVHSVWSGIGAADGAHDFVLNSVEMHHFTIYGFDASPSGGADCYNGTFNDCIAHTCRDPTQNVDGFALGHGTQHDFVFNRCVVYDVFDGFDISARDTTLNSCAAYDCRNGGYKLWQDSVTLVDCLSYHNEITNVELDWDGEPGTTTLRNCHFVGSESFNVWVENSNDHLHMYNCIIACGDNLGLAFEQMGTANYRGDYNIFHNEDTERAIVVGYEDEFSLNQIAAGDWTTYSSQDQHSLVSFDPETELFTDLSKWDLHLQEGSIAIDSGTSENAPTVDYDGANRPQGEGYDIGAYEIPEFSSIIIMLIILVSLTVPIISIRKRLLFVQ